MTILSTSCSVSARLSSADEVERFGRLRRFAERRNEGPHFDGHLATDRGVARSEH